MQYVYVYVHVWRFQKEMATEPVRPRPVLTDVVPYEKLGLVLGDIKPIGRGAFGDVYKCVHKDWGCQLAYKRLEIRGIDDR